MKKFNLHVAYLAINQFGQPVIGDTIYWVESKVKPKVTPEFLERVKEAIKPDGAKITILNWQWFD